MALLFTSYKILGGFVASLSLFPHLQNEDNNNKCAVFVCLSLFSQEITIANGSDGTGNHSAPHTLSLGIVLRDDLSRARVPL